MKTLFVVALALIDRQERVLLAQRPEGRDMAGLWEFPGGKVQEGETPEAALVREIKEELGLTLEPSALRPLSFASHSYPTFHLVMPLYACRVWQGEAHPHEGQKLAWVLPSDLETYAMPPADVPLIAAVRRFLQA